MNLRIELLWNVNRLVFFPSKNVSVYDCLFVCVCMNACGNYDSNLKLKQTKVIINLCNLYGYNNVSAPDVVRWYIPFSANFRMAVTNKIFMQYILGYSTNKNKNWNGEIHFFAIKNVQMSKLNSILKNETILFTRVSFSYYHCIRVNCFAIKFTLFLNFSTSIRVSFKHTSFLLHFHAHSSFKIMQMYYCIIASVLIAIVQWMR